MVKALTLWKDSFTTFAHVSILCFSQIGVITRTRDKFVEIVTASERYQATLSVKLAEGKILMKKEKNSST